MLEALGAHHPNPTYQFVYTLLKDDLTPLLTIVTIVARFIGIAFIITALGRLYRLSTQTMMHRVTLLPTVLMFFVGTVFLSYTPYLTALSNSLFLTANSGSASSIAATALNSPCPADTIIPVPDGYDDTSPFCPILQYADMAKGKNPMDLVAPMAYGILMLVGVISFLKGMVSLVKVGDGGQQGTLPKAVTHIIAGLVGVNAESVYNLLYNVYSGLVPPST